MDDQIQSVKGRHSRDPTTTPIGGSPVRVASPTVWDLFNVESLSQITGIEVASQINEGQNRDCYVHDEERGVVHSQIVDREHDDKLKAGGEWRARRGKVKLKKEEEDDLLVEHNPSDYSRRLLNRAGKKGFEPKLSQRRKNSGWRSDLELTSIIENASTLEDSRRTDYGLQRQKNGIKRRRTKSFISSLKQMESGRRVICRGQIRRETTSRTASQHNQNGYKSIYSPFTLNSLEQSQRCAESFSVLTLERLLRERPYLRQNIGEDISSWKIKSRSIRHQSHPFLTESTYTKQKSKNRLKKERESSLNDVNWSRTDTKKNFVRKLGDVLPRTRILSIPSFAVRVDDDGIQSFDSHKQGCGIPWHCSGIHKGKAKKHADLSGRSFSRGFTYPSKGEAWKLVNKDRYACRKESNPVKCVSEKDLSSSDSEIETFPLLTDPECYYGNRDVAIASSVDSSESPPEDIAVNLELNGHEEFQNEKEGTYLSIKIEDALKSISSLGGVETKMDKNRSLTQKYRPKSFKELVGQTMVSQSLSNAVLKGKIAPVYLFQGPRGTGKTSAARIFAAAVNCLSVEQVRPCGFCRDCIIFSLGKNIDFREVDAAGNNGIESMKILLTHVALPPSSSRYKILIIDECHMLTTEAWNAFLKSLEEPPSYAVFILITTYPEQLPLTAASRCQRFLFPKIKESDILIKIQKLALLEKISIEEEALQLIATRSDGSLRDAETMLDQLSLLGQKVTVQMVHELVGSIPDDKLINLLGLALSANIVSTVRCIKELTDSGVEPLALMSQLATLITDVLAGNNMSRKDTKMAGLLSEHLPNKDELERLRQALKILSEAEKQLRASNDRTTWLMAALLQFAPSNPYFLPTSLGTNVTQNPVAFLDTSGKETENFGDKITTQLWKAQEQRKQTQLQLQKVTTVSAESERQVEAIAEDSNILCLQNHSKKFIVHTKDNKVYPCDQSAQFAVNVEEKKTDDESQPLVILDYSGDVSKVGLVSSSKMNDVWRRVLNSSIILRHLLCEQAKLLSLSIFEAFAVANLEFQQPEDKAKAEGARRIISNAFQVALGCPVEVNLSLASFQGLDTTDLKKFPANPVKPENYFKQTSKTQFLNSGGKFSAPSQEQSIPVSHKKGQIGGSFKKALRSLKSTACTLGCQVSHAECDTWENHELGTSSTTEPSSWSNTDIKTEANALDKKGHLGNSLRRNPDVVGSHAAKSHALLQHYVHGRYQNVKDRELDNRSIVPVKAGALTLGVVIQQADGSIDDYSQDLIYDDINGSLKGKADKDLYFSNPIDSEISDCSECINQSRGSKYRNVGLLCWKGNALERKFKQQRRCRKRKARFLLQLVPCARRWNRHVSLKS